jgi:diacyltrehalose acyltransferase
VTITPTGIPSGEAFGSLGVTQIVRPSGIPSAEILGSLGVTQTVKLTGIASAEAFGLTRTAQKQIAPAAIHSSQALGPVSVAQPTVFLLGGAFSNLQLYNYMPSQLQGAITNGNNTVIVPYNTNGLFLNIVQQGAQMLNAYLNQGGGNMVAFGHSLGAVVCNYWLNVYAPTTNIPYSHLSFVWIGNSVNVYGGALGPNTHAWLPNWFGFNVAAPSGTSYTCTNITRQYDGWADWPTGTMNVDAEMNAFSGQSIVHNSYQNINPSPTATGNVSHVVGNITYIWSMTEPIPLLGNSWNAFTDPLDLALRPTIETAYSRPVTIPTPIY